MGPWRSLAAISALLLAACSSNTERGSEAATDVDVPAKTPKATASEPKPKPDASSVPDPEPERHVVFSFSDNKLLLHHRADGGLYVHAGSAGFAKYSRYFGGWSYSRLVDGTRAAMSTRNTARIDVPFGETAAADKPMWLRVHSKRARTLKVGKNRIALSPGWQTIEARGDFVAGENRITLRNANGVALAWMQLAGERPEDDAGREHPVRDGSLVLGRGEAAVYYTYIPKDAVVVGTVVPAECAVTAVAITNAERAEGSLPAAEMGELAGQVARLEIVAGDCDSVTISGAGIAIPGPTATVPSRGEPPKHVLLWVMDTLRADRVRVSTPGARPDVPSFERLAARGVVFRQAYVQGNESQTSHASIWTATYPAVHGIRTAGKKIKMRLHKRFNTLPQAMKKAGMATYAITANGMITRSGGYSRGFDSFVNPMRDGTGSRRNGWIPAERLTRRLIARLSKDPEEPWFLFFGTIDTHKPWVGHEPWLSKYDPEPYRGYFKKKVSPRHLGMVRGSMRCVQVPKPRDLKRINAIYDSDVSYQDQQLGVVLDQLDEWGILEETMVIVTADHGEELWEVGRCGHGASLRETVVRVPLVISYPPLLPSGEIVEEGVDVLDLLPTIADILGAEHLDQYQGASLRPLAYGVGRGYPRASYASQYEYAHAMRIGPWKLRVGKRAELYDLESDPAEKIDVVADRPIARRFMIDPLATFLAYRRRWNKQEWGPANNMTAAAASALEASAK